MFHGGTLEPSDLELPTPEALVVFPTSSSLHISSTSSVVPTSQQVN